MKFILAVLLLMQSPFIYGQGINALKNDDEVFAFFNKVFTKSRSVNYPSYESHFKKSAIDTLYKYYHCNTAPLNYHQANQWQKIDFNNDGLMDLFIIVDEGTGLFPSFIPFVIIGIHDTAYKVVDLSWIDGICQVYIPVQIDKKQLLLSYIFKPFYLSADSISFRTDTLIYKFNNFIEYNTDSIFPAIQSVSFSHSSCMLPCAQYKITINKSKNITLDGYDNTPYRGHYRSIIAEEKFREIFDLLTYVNPKKLKDIYGQTGTDGPTAYLEIKFADGTTKEIEGAGWGGTNALHMVYNYFESVYKNQRWYK